MENQKRQIESIPTLNFHPIDTQKIKNERKLLQLYSKCDSQKNKKLKSEALVHKYILGFASVLGLNIQKISMISEEVLISQFTLFMQNAIFKQMKKSDQYILDPEYINILINGKIQQKREQDFGNSKLGFLTSSISVNNYFRNCKKSFISLQCNGILITPKPQKKNCGSKRASKAKISSKSKIQQDNNLQSTKSNFKSDEYGIEVEVNQQKSPILLENLTEIRQYRNCNKKALCFVSNTQASTIVSFPTFSVSKIEAFIQHQQRQVVINFISKCLAIQQGRAASKLYAKIYRKSYLHKHIEALQQNRIYMLYSGQILLNINKSYRIYVRQNGIIRPKKGQCYEILVTRDHSLIISVDYESLTELFQEYYPQVLEKIQQQLQFVLEQRKAYFQKQITEEAKRKIEQNKELSKAFFSHNLPDKPLQSNQRIINQLRVKPVPIQSTLIKAVEKIQKIKQKLETSNSKSNNRPYDNMNLSLSHFGHDYTDRRKSMSKYFNKKSTQLERQKQDLSQSSYSAKRFKIINTSSSKYQNSQQQYYGPGTVDLMSNYPYCKIVQGQQRIHEYKKSFSRIRKQKPEQHSACSQTNKMSSYKVNNKSQQLKQKRKLYYMDKVRRLKIKNIAQRQIPNGRNKKFKSQQAQKQIASYCLFTHVIEYPVDGYVQKQKQVSTTNSSKKFILQKEQKTNKKGFQERKTYSIAKSKLRQEETTGIDSSYAQNCLSVIDFQSSKNEDKQNQGISNSLTRYKCSTAYMPELSLNQNNRIQNLKIKDFENKQIKRLVKKRPVTGKVPCYSSSKTQSRNQFYKNQRLNTLT